VDGRSSSLCVNPQLYGSAVGNRRGLSRIRCRPDRGSYRPQPGPVGQKLRGLNFRCRRRVRPACRNCRLGACRSAPGRAPAHGRIIRRRNRRQYAEEVVDTCYATCKTGQWGEYKPRSPSVEDYFSAHDHHMQSMRLRSAERFPIYAHASVS
jgi:hypothetical protein